MIELSFWKHRVPFAEECWIAINAGGDIFAFNIEPEFDSDEGTWGFPDHADDNIHLCYRIGVIGDAEGDDPVWDEDDDSYLECPEELLWLVEPLTEKHQLEYFELQKAWAAQEAQSAEAQQMEWLRLERTKLDVPLDDWAFFSPAGFWPEKIRCRPFPPVLAPLIPSRTGLYVLGNPLVTFPYFAYEVFEEEEDVIQRATAAVA